nr:hypothetical protein [Tanacetum cinerariifolium]
MCKPTTKALWPVCNILYKPLPCYGRGGQRNNARGTSAAGNEGAQNRVMNVNPGQARQIKCYNCNGGQDNAIDEDFDEPSVQDYALNVDNAFQANECDACDSNADKAPTA